MMQPHPGGRKVAIEGGGEGAGPAVFGSLSNAVAVLGA
jgi:hypothetical protein